MSRSGHRALAGVVGVVAGLVCATGAAPVSAATVYTVTGTSDPAPTPLCSVTVCPSLRAAIAAANSDPGSTVQLGSGTYTLSQGSLQLAAAMTIVGDGPSATTIRQTASDRVIFATAVGAEVNIDGLTITGGSVSGAAGASVLGGGILNWALMKLTNVVLTGNSATGGDGGSQTDGGGALGSAIATGDQLDDKSTLTLVDSTVTANTAQGGAGGSGASGAAGSGGFAVGAIWANDNATVALRDSVVSNNQMLGGVGGEAGATTAGVGGSVGGAVYAELGTLGNDLAIINSTIADNTATGGAGGAVLFTVTPGPAGGSAAGAGVSDSTKTQFLMTGSTVSGNTVTGGHGGFSTNSVGGAGGSAEGGGIELHNSASVIVNSTITGNNAAGGASGVGTTDGSQGTGSGGGAHVPKGATFASVTLMSNGATGLVPGSVGGNLTVVGSTGFISIADTIIAGGSASDSGGNCDLAIPIMDNGHNLEDTNPSQCGFSSVNGDLIGGNPGLLALAANGGPTQTRALGPGSQALGSGGACMDSSQPGSPRLTIDQRGFPRPAGACDIGAFQYQPPAGTAAPQISGALTVGQVLTCSQGGWSGDQLTFGFQWLRDGAPIAGAASPTYTVADGDQGDQLVCRVTASNLKGTANQTSAPVKVPFPDQSLIVSKTGDGSGTVTSSPAGISCGAACSHAYSYGSAVTLTAHADSGSMFAAWSGACAGMPDCTLSLTAPKAVTATFLKDCLVPKLKGKSLKKAKRAIKAHDCTIGKIKHATSTKVKKGDVISQMPKPGKPLKHGARVSIVLSKG